MTRGSCRGFSLLEVMVTMAILLVLLTAGGASYALIKSTAADRDAQAVLDRGTMAQRAWVARNATWADDPAVLNLGRGLVGSTSASGSPTVISMAVDSAHNLGLAVQSESGTCFARVISDPLLDGTELSLELAEDVSCSGVSALAAD